MDTQQFVGCFVGLDVGIDGALVGSSVGSYQSSNINYYPKNIDIIDVFNNDAVTSTNSLSYGVAFPAVIVVNSYIYIFGGDDFATVTNVHYSSKWQYYELPPTDEPTSAPSIPTSNPTKQPTNAPSSPSTDPTQSPTPDPTSSPTTKMPTTVSPTSPTNNVSPLLGTTLNGSTILPEGNSRQLPCIDGIDTILLIGGMIMIFI